MGFWHISGFKWKSYYEISTFWSLNVLQIIQFYNWCFTIRSIVYSWYSVYSVSNVHLSIHAWRNSASHSLPPMRSSRLRTSMLFKKMRHGVTQKNLSWWQNKEVFVALWLPFWKNHLSRHFSYRQKKLILKDDYVQKKGQTKVLNLHIFEI